MSNDLLETTQGVYIQDIISITIMLHYVMAVLFKFLHSIMFT